MKKIILLALVLTSASTLSSRENVVDDTISQEQEIKLARQRYDVVREELDRLVTQNIDATSVHFVLRLLEVELQLVDTLLRDETGAKVDELLSKKRNLIKTSTKVGVYLYKAIMNFAMNDILLPGKDGALKLGSTLRGADKRCYLKRIKRILIQYRNALFYEQYESLKYALGLPSARYAPYVPRESQALPDIMQEENDAQVSYASCLHDDPQE